MKIISLGGWDFSTMPGAFNILRIAVQPGNRYKFKNNLDGIDLDWEPLEFPTSLVMILSMVRTATNSFPVSRTPWALPNQLPSRHRHPLVPQGVTYQEHDQGPGLHPLHDLQWDYNNKRTSSSCETSNCLRSHVNETETKSNVCRSSCHYATCLEDCIKGSDCKNGRGTIDIACPQMEFQRSIADGDPTSIPNARFSLMDADGFWKDIREGS
ncbi:hypothetical protein F5X96DRAFT_692052 [Biscogniauxia mediterranea]|nr:hypothetical protein F5X96DRAFT_692052 [Biscogniauxia mediterranea]